MRITNAEKVSRRIRENVPSRSTRFVALDVGRTCRDERSDDLVSWRIVRLEVEVEVKRIPLAASLIDSLETESEREIRGRHREEVFVAVNARVAESLRPPGGQRSGVRCIERNHGQSHHPTPTSLHVNAFRTILGNASHLLRSDQRIVSAFVVDQRRKSVRRRYLSLGMGELAAAAVFAAVAVGVVTPRLEGPQDSAALWSALAPLLVILTQAGVYWLLARGWTELESMPARLAALYRVFRLLDVLLLAIALLGVVIWLPDHSGTAVGVVAVWAFGVVEYVNYFVARLAYPLRRWPFEVGKWRRPQLVRDLNSAR